MHQTPIPLWDLADMDKYAYMIVQYSRGCPYMCDFCDVTALQWPHVDYYRPYLSAIC